MARISSRWLTSILLMTMLLGACDGESPTATPSVGNSNEQPTFTPAPTFKVDITTPTSTVTVGATVQVSKPDTPTPISAIIGTPPAGTPRPTQPPPTPEPPVAPSSLDKIGTAREAGDLDGDTALIYELYAYYLPDKLPEEYRGDDSGPFPEPTFLFSELNERMDRLPASAKADIEPFFLRPDNPQSVWYGITTRATGLNVRGSGLAIMAAPHFAYKDTAHIRVWYDANSPTGTQKATQLAAEIERSKMWDKEKTAMLGREPCSDKDLKLNGGDGKVDLYLIPQATRVHRADSSGQEIEPEHSKLAGSEGLAVALGPIDTCPNSSFLLIDVAPGMADIKTTAAHELFHAFQFSFKRVGLNSDYGWWVEGSAAWAEDLVYPTNAPGDDTEWGYLHQNWAYRPEYDGPLDAYRTFQSGIKDYPQYAAYLWAFYLRQKANGDETIVGDMWTRSETEIPLKVMQHTGDWDERFKEFALWNWNREPVQKYDDNGRAIKVLGQNPASEVLAVNHQTYRDDLDLPKVSARYYMLDITDLGEQGTYGFVNQVRFDFTGLRGQPDLGIQAIIQTGQNTEVPKGYIIEDWSDENEKVICREVEPVSRVVLVVTNGTIEEGKNVKGPLKAEALNVDCPKEASFTFNMESEYSLDKSEPLQEKGSANISQMLTSSWDIAFVEHQDTEQSTRFTDITSYVFTATNSYEVSMSGIYNSTNIFDTVTANLTAGGIYETHNPPLPTEDEYKYTSQYSGPNAANALATRRGTIKTYKDRSGIYQSIIAFEPPPVALRYEVSRHLVRNCPPNESATYDETTNEAGVNAVAQGSPDCLNSGATLSSHNFVRPTPELYGPPSFTPDSRSPGNWLITQFDPAKGIIDGQLDFSVDTCQQAAQVNTLHLFATLLPAVDSYSGQEAKGCSVSYHAQYHVKLPVKNSQNR